MTASIDIQDGVAVITMNDGKANAINPPMLEALHAALDKVEADENAKSVVIAGLPGKFSAGFDLKYFQSEGMEKARALVDGGGALALRLYGFPKPVIAAITGHAIAMGCFLAQSCDVRIAVSGPFKIGANETIIDMVIPEFARELLLARVRSDRLTEAAVLARLYSPEEAVEVGYIDQVVAPEALMETATGLAKMLGELPAKAYAGNKHLIRRESLAAMKASLPA